MRKPWWLLLLLLSWSLPALAAAGDLRSAGPAAKGRAGTTVILVHGAFADSSSWDGVASRLLKRRFNVVAASVPLRGLAVDATSVADLVNSIAGDIVLVGHSYGGQVITAAASGNPRIKGLVYVDALAPDMGESASDIGERFPGATLGPALAPPVPLKDGGKDLYIRQDRLPDQFAADVPLAKARLMAVEQRPVTDAALKDKLQQTPAWKSTPSWFIYGSLDKNITPEAQAFMARRAHSRHTVVIEGGSHVVMISHPDAVAKLIAEAVGADKP
jgi:pimeloyl-ACP methyl ester carboxylesterase